MYDSTLTFKTRRKHLFLLLSCLTIFINDVASMAMPISCPEPCECYLNNNGLQSARCSELYSNQTAFPNIHVLVLQMSESQNQCNIPNYIHLILPQLNFVYMMNCSLAEIPVETFKNLESLQEVDLSNNYLKKLDPSLFINNAKLSYANLQNNPFHVPDRPFLISKSLREIDLTSCGIKELPENMFKNLTKLQYLILNDNKLTTVEEDTLPSGIKVLTLSKNLIKKVPIAELERLKKIRQVDLSDNPINCTCELLNFENSFSGKPVIFLNGIQCMYPREYRGFQIHKVPEYELCDAKVAARTDLGDNDDDDEETEAALKSNQIIPEEEPKKKKDNVQDDFERDQVVPFDKKSSADYIDQMQSDSISDEGSGDGDGTEMPDTDGTITDNDDVEPKTNAKSDNDENNETKPEGTGQLNPEPSPDPKPEEPVTEKKSDVTSYEDELTTLNNNTNNESAINPPIVSEPEKKPEDIEPSTELAKPVETSSSEPESTNPESGVPTPVPESTNPESETSSHGSHPPPESETPVPLPGILESSAAEDGSTTEPAAPKQSEKPPADPSNETETTKLIVDNKTTADVSVVSHAQLQKDISNSDSSIFNLGYIIPCMAILIVILICLGVYLGQRSSHKNWEPANTNTNNDGAELQDVSLLPDRSKMPIVKNKKYPTEGNSEQTERLMNDGEPTTPKSIWEHLEEPIENGNSKHPKDSQLPNGQPIDKNEPIECAIVKVTTLPDSIPRTPLIRNT